MPLALYTHPGCGSYYGRDAQRAALARAGWTMVLTEAGQPPPPGPTPATPDGTSDDGAQTLAESTRDTIAAALTAGANVTITVDDVGDTITIAAATTPYPPDATTTSKGLARILAGTADAPQVPAAALTGIIDDARIPDGITRDAELAAAVTAVIAQLRGAAPAALDTFFEVAQQLATDESGAAALAALVAAKGQRLTRRSVTASTTAAPGELIVADASTASLTVTIPAATAQAPIDGSTIAVKKGDTSPNTVTIAMPDGSTIVLRDSAETRTLDATGTTWDVTSGLNTLSALTARFLPALPRGWDTAGTDGVLSGQRSADGNTYFVTGMNPLQVVSAAGWFGFASGILTGNFYVMPDLPADAKVRRHRVEFVLDPSDSVTSGATFGVFDAHSPTMAAVHCSIQPHYLRLSTINGLPVNATEVVHTPIGWPDIPAAPCRFPRAIPADGVTRTIAEFLLVDEPAGTVCFLLLVIAGELMVLKFGPHPHFAMDVRYPFVQSKVDTAGDAIARFSRESRSWDTAIGSARTAFADRLELARSTFSRLQGGAGLPHLRPPSRARGGAHWTVPAQTITLSADVAAGATTFTTAYPIRPGTTVTIDTGSKREARTISSITGSGSSFTSTVAALTNAHTAGAAIVLPAHDTYSDGTRWLDASGRVVSNRLPPAIATCHEPSGDLSVFQLARTEVRAPATHTGWRSARVQRAVATADGNCVLYVTGASVSAVDPGEPYAVLTGQVGMQGNARNAYVVGRWLDASSAQVGSDFSAAVVNAPTSGAPVATPPAVAVAPPGAAQLSLQSWGQALVKGDVMLATELCVVSAHGPTVAYIAA